jgi:hypothetical protein
MTKQKNYSIVLEMADAQRRAAHQFRNGSLEITIIEISDLQRLWQLRNLAMHCTVASEIEL